MTVIVCLDNANGMMFNHRRQSRDANVVKDILKTINGASLLIAPYSEPLFSQAECSVSISDSFLADADAKDYCFVENTSVATVYKGNIIKNLIMDCQSYTKYRPNETTGGIFVSWRRKEELPTGA